VFAVDVFQKYVGGGYAPITDWKEAKRLVSKLSSNWLVIGIEKKFPSIGRRHFHQLPLTTDYGRRQKCSCQKYEAPIVLSSPGRYRPWAIDCIYYYERRKNKPNRVLYIIISDGEKDHVRRQVANAVRMQPEE